MSTSAIWSLKVVSAVTGTTSGSLASYGIEKPQVTFRSQDDDEMVFDIRNNVLNSNTLFYADQVTLLRNGVIWFLGTVTKAVTVASAKEETTKYVVSNVWYQLKRTLWQVPCACYQQFSQSCQLELIKMTKVVLFQDPALGSSITTAQQITNILDYAITVGIPVAFGVLPSFVTVPFEETRDLTLADVIRRCLQWSPDAVSWFSYSSGASIFQAEVRAFLSTVTLDLSDEDLVEDFTLQERSGLVPSGVRFNFIGNALCNVEVPNGCVDPSTGILNTGAEKLSQSPVQVQTITQDVAGIPDLPGGIVASIDLTQLTASTSESAPIGLASSYYLSLLTPIWDGTVVLHEQECSGTLRPGLALNFTGGQTGWTTMNAQIQEVKEDLDTGRTEATFGTPGHLMPQNFVTLLQMSRRRPLVTSGLAAVNFPGSGGNSCPQGTSPETQKLLNKVGGSSSAVAAAIGANGLKNILPTCSIGVCENGTPSTLAVYCPGGQAPS